MFCVPCAPTRQTGFAELGSPPTKSPLLHDEKLAPVTAFAVSRSDWSRAGPSRDRGPIPSTCGRDISGRARPRASGVVKESPTNRSRTDSCRLDVHIAISESRRRAPAGRPCRLNRVRSGERSRELELDAESARQVGTRVGHIGPRLRLVVVHDDVDRFARAPSCAAKGYRRARVVVLLIAVDRGRKR